MTKKYPLSYFEDSAQLFAPIANKPWSVFLDSGYPYSDQGRYDILSTDPVTTLVTSGDTTEITEHRKISYSEKDPFELVKQYLNVDFQPIKELPFNGGAMGYFSYDLVRRLEKLPVIASDEENLAEMSLGIYTWAVIVDHYKRQSWLVSNGVGKDECNQLIKQFNSLPKKVQHESFCVLDKTRSNMDKQRYKQAFEKIKHYLKEGDSYQVNLAQRFVSSCLGNPWTAYQLLRKINPAPFSAYLNHPAVQVLSSSPERFLKVTKAEVETKPIKGTRRRNQDSGKDERQKNALLDSKKDCAENVMIVDLLRNDLSKNCKQGSVKVPQLFNVESFATVHHLVSTVTGVLEEGQHALDLLRNCFPGGSITGTPKIRSMEIIEELEPNRRGLYCGAIGYIGFDGNMDTNIVIRTLIHSENSIRFWAGGGIVYDSVMDDEYQESLDKAAALLDLLEKFRVNEGH